MNKSLIGVSLAAATLAVAAAGLAQAAEPLQPYPVKGQVIQRLKAFDNPEGSIFSADGRFVFISNSAELGMPDKGYHLTDKAGYISKLAVQPDGTLKMVNEKLITGLTGPLGMAVSPVATRKFPKGTVFLIEAWAPLAEADGTEVKDPSVLDPKIIAFNTDGKILGAIKMGAGSPAAAAAGVIATLANTLSFDKEGNLSQSTRGSPGAHSTHRFRPKEAGHICSRFPRWMHWPTANRRPCSTFRCPMGGLTGLKSLLMVQFTSTRWALWPG